MPIHIRICMLVYIGVELINLARPADYMLNDFRIVLVERLGVRLTWEHGKLCADAKLKASDIASIYPLTIALIVT